MDSISWNKHKRNISSTSVRKQVIFFINNYNILSTLLMKVHTNLQLCRHKLTENIEAGCSVAKHVRCRARMLEPTFIQCVRTKKKVQREWHLLAWLFLRRNICCVRLNHPAIMGSMIGELSLFCTGTDNDRALPMHNSQGDRRPDTGCALYYCSAHR